MSGFARRLGAIAAGALALRVLCLVLVGRDDNPSVPIGDAWFFHTVANLIADGRGYLEPFTWQTQQIEMPTAGHPPLWPGLLSLFSAVGLDSADAHRVAGVLVGTVAVVLVGLIGRSVGGPRAGLIAAGIAAVYPVWVSADGSGMSEPLYGALVALALWAALRLREPGPGVRTALVLGAAAGLAALTRTEGLALVLLVTVVPLTRARVVAVVAACVVVLVPWTIRNATTFSEPVLVSTNAGAVIGGANCAEVYSGPRTGMWSFECVTRATPELRPPYDESVAAARWRQAGVRYAREHAGELPRVAGVRVLRTWDAWQPVRQAELNEGENGTLRKLALPAVYLLFALAAFGAWRLARHGERRTLAILLLPAVLVTVTSALAWGWPRFRHGAEVGLIVLAAVAVAHRTNRTSSPHASLATTPI